MDAEAEAVIEPEAVFCVDDGPTFVAEAALVIASVKSKSRLLDPLEL